MNTSQRIGALIAAAAILMAACSSDGGNAATTVAETTVAAETTAAETTSPETTAPETTVPETTAAPETTLPADAPWVPNAGVLAGAEGALNVVDCCGYAATIDATAFESSTACKVTITNTDATSLEMLTLLQKAEIDGGVATGEVTTQLIDGGLVAALDPAELPSFADLFESLKVQPWNSKDGVPYGMPISRAVNLLAYNTETFPSAPDSWSVVFEADSPAAGKISAYGGALYIADAATYLMSTRPELGIKDPYSLDADQFAATMAVLEAQKSILGADWDFNAGGQAQVEGMKSGAVLAGSSWLGYVQPAKSAGATVEATKPKEGATGWSDTWVLSAKSVHPNCMKLWLDYVSSPQVNGVTASSFSSAPSNARACEIDDLKDGCEQNHATDESYWADVHIWTYPTEECRDGRTDVKCVPYPEWQKAWTALRA